MHRAARSKGRADLAECRRRLALRCGFGRPGGRWHEALRPRRLQAGRRNHHQPPGGRRPAPQQRCHLLALFLQGRAFDVLYGAGALDRRRRAKHRVRRRRDGRRPLARRASARPAQDLRGGQAQRDALPGRQGQHPFSGVLARRHEIADGGLPSRGSSHGRVVRQVRQGHDPRRHRADFRRDRAEVPQRGGAASRRCLRGRGFNRRRWPDPRRGSADPGQDRD